MTVLKIPDLSLVVLVGVTGSGKSTFAARHFRPTEVISSDFCRGLVSDDENDQSATGDAFEVLNFIAAKRLAAGRLTVADAIKNGKPTLVLFATPRYCVSRMCGPTLEMLNGLKQKYGDQANFIHIEVYQDFNTFTPVPEMDAWHLPSEPWLFMIDRAGRIAAKFEGGLTRQEIEPALLELLKR